MFCNRYEKVKENGMYYYYPIIEDYFFSEQYKREKGSFGFKVPKDIEQKQAVPLLNLDNEEFDKLSYASKTIAISHFQCFIFGIHSYYPRMICVEVEGGKYVRFKFQHYLTVDYMKTPFVSYEVLDVVEKKEASYYLVCIENK